LAVRLSHGYDHEPGYRALQQCEICGQINGATACEPLLVGGQAIGSVLVASRKVIDADRRARLHESVAQAAPILANQRNLTVAERHAASDALTGLPNRRAADEVLKRMAAQAGRSVSPLAAILLDLDHFKKVNDTFGHEVGDGVLVRFAAHLLERARAYDTVSRLGGEEFLVVYPGLSEQDGAVRAQRVVEMTPAACAEALPPGWSQTVSAGFACYPLVGKDPEDVLRLADAALYEAKSAGRNRVCIATESHDKKAASLAL